MSDELLCIDTNVMIWGILQSGKTESERLMVEKASLFFEDGFNEGKTFAISIVTFSEFMIQIPPEERDRYLELISKNFVLLPFSEDAAMKAADIFRDQYQKMKTAYRGSRGILRQDIQILASAIVFGSNVILITEDAALRELAGNTFGFSGFRSQRRFKPCCCKNKNFTFLKETLDNSPAQAALAPA